MIPDLPLVELWRLAMRPYLLLAIPFGIAYTLILIFTRRCGVARCVLAVIISCSLLALVAVFAEGVLRGSSRPNPGFAYGFAASVILGLYTLLSIGLRLYGELFFSGGAFDLNGERASGD